MVYGFSDLELTGEPFGSVVVGADDEELSIAALCELMASLVPAAQMSTGDWRTAFWASTKGEVARAQAMIVADLRDMHRHAD